MIYLYTKNLVKNSAAFKLFRKEYAPFIISFLYTEFKSKELLTVIAEDLTRSLSHTIEDYKSESILENELLLSPDHYINEWINDGFLRKFYEDAKDDASDAMDEMGDAAGEAMDEASDAASDAADAAGEAADDAVDAAGEAVDDAVDAGEAAAEEARKNAAESMKDMTK